MWRDTGVTQQQQCSNSHKAFLKGGALTQQSLKGIQQRLKVQGTIRTPKFPIHPQKLLESETEQTFSSDQDNVNTMHASQSGYKRPCKADKQSLIHTTGSEVQLMTHHPIQVNKTIPKQHYQSPLH